MSSTSYVLAEYNDQTRKIQGEWKKKSYKNLMSEIRSKFSIDRSIDLEIKVYDKKNNKYFSIDKYEMNEIPKGGLIRVVKTKSQIKTKKPSSPKRGTGISSVMKPPGVPPYSKQDDLKRNNWKINSRVEIYSEGQRKWQKGTIVDIFNDNEGEWLVIKYAGFRTKEIQRFSNYIRPVQKQISKQNKNKQNKKQQSKQQQQQQQQQSKQQQQQQQQQQSSGGNNKTDNKKNIDKKSEKIIKITTQSKYKKKEKIPQISILKENEIHIKGNSQHIKKYIDKACILLRGFDAGSKDNNNTGIKGVEDDTKDTINKKYDIIILFGTGRAMGFVVSTAEIVKRIIGNLYQVTILESIQVTDVWQPLEAGLKEVETTKPVAQLRIILAVNECDIDISAKGYQEPIAVDDFAANLEYHYDDDGHSFRVRSRGGKSNRGNKGGNRGSRGSNRGKGGYSGGTRGGHGHGRGGKKGGRGKGRGRGGHGY